MATNKFCCQEMTARISESFDELGEIQYDEVDVIINHWKNGTYGIPIHDGGTSMVVINFCPWCGKKLSGKNGGIRMIEVD